MKATQDLEFEGFRVDVQRRRLLRADGTAIALTPKAFDTLLYLVQHPGDVVEKDALLAAVWPGVVVEDNNLSQAVSALRKALGDDPEAPRFIQTVPRRGFRFVAPVRQVAASGRIGDATESSRVEANSAAATSTPQQHRVPEQTSPLQAGSRRRKLLIGGAAIAALGGGLGVWWLARWRDEPPAGGGQPLQMLAVLPFKPLVQEQRDEVLEVGMADSLIARLSTVPGLVVRSIGSARRYGGPTQDPLVAARELEVDWIVDGTVQRWGDQVRVTARLLRADGTARWSGSFDEKFTSVFDVQAMIADRVAGVLAPRLGARDRQGHGSGGTHNADAYQLYLAARHAAQTLRPSGLAKSVVFYKKAIALDPNYARAYAGLAETYRRLPFGADTPPAEAFEPARAAALRAIEIDPGLAEGHAGIGWVKFWYEWDWPGAEKAFRRAIELNPSVWEAHLGLGHLLSSLGRGDEGFAHIQRARELDPMSMITNTLEAGYLLGRGRRAEADQRLQRALELDPEFWVGHLTHASFYLADKQPAKALEALRTADRYSEGQSTQALALIGFLLGRTGQTEQAQAVLDRLLQLSRQRYVPPTSIAAVYTGLGDKGKALDYLERAYDVRDLRLAFMRIDGRRGPLKEEPRFLSLLKTMKLDTAPAGKAAH
jgi:DNA-binding winged helix-turn-helix (wHTH) protein/TolB-like protein/tetratricopeptide (TPR) repeat protein